MSSSLISFPIFFNLFLITSSFDIHVSGSLLQLVSLAKKEENRTHLNLKPPGDGFLNQFPCNVTHYQFGLHPSMLSVYIYSTIADGIDSLNEANQTIRSGDNVAAMLGRVNV